MADFEGKHTEKMAYIMVDIESDGPIPGDFSMVSFGAVLVDELRTTKHLRRPHHKAFNQ